MDLTKQSDHMKMVLALLPPPATKEAKPCAETTGKSGAHKFGMWMPIGRFQAAEFYRSIAEQHGKLAQTARKLGIRGVNSRWEFSTLEAKIEAERQRMIAEVRRRKLPGSNLSSNWKVNTLFAKLTLARTNSNTPDC